MERQSINEKFMKIMSLALEISPADKEVKHGKPHVFVRYSPHVISLEVTVYLDGWVENNKADYHADCYGYQKNVCEQVDKVISYLENLKSEINKRLLNG